MNRLGRFDDRGRPPSTSVRTLRRENSFSLIDTTMPASSGRNAPERHLNFAEGCLFQALSRSRILLVNAAAHSSTALRKINHLGPSTSARNPLEMAYSWRVRQCLADVRRMLRLLRNERT